MNYGAIWSGGALKRVPEHAFSTSFGTWYFSAGNGIMAIVREVGANIDTRTYKEGNTVGS